LMPPFGFTLDLRMEGCAANVLHAVVLQPRCQIPKYIARAIITQQALFVANGPPVHPARRQDKGHTIGNRLARGILSITKGGKRPFAAVAMAFIRCFKGAARRLGIILLCSI